MERATYVVFTHPTSPAVEEEYNRWYSDVHLANVLDVPGVVGATRYALDDQTSGAAPYLALYELESESVDDTVAEIMTRAGTPEMVLSDTLCREGDRAPRKLLYRRI